MPDKPEVIDNGEALSLIERLGRTFDSLTKRDFGKRFYNDSFLNELLEKRSAADAEMGKSFGVTALFASIVVFFDLVSGSFSLGSGLSISLSRDISPIICFLTASSLLRTTLLFIDVQIANQILIRIGQSIGVSSMNLIFINKRVNGIWSDALVPTYFGIQSGKAHHRVFNLIGILFLLLGILMFMYPSAAIILSAKDIYYSDVRFMAKSVSYFSVAMLIFNVILIGCFCLRYQFLPADFDETTREPTEHFNKEMERKFAEENSAGDPSRSTS